MAVPERSVATKASGRAKKAWWKGLNHDQFADELFARLESETDPVLTSEHIDAIESFIKTSGVARRAALIYLSKPWKEIAKSIAEDRDLAVAFANIADCLEGDVKQYKALSDLLQKAHMRMLVALCQREDMRAILAESKAVNAKEAGHG